MIYLFFTIFTQALVCVGVHVCVCLCVLSCIVSMSEQADPDYFVFHSLIHPPALDCSDALGKSCRLKSLILCLHIFFWSFISWSLIVFYPLFHLLHSLSAFSFLFSLYLCWIVTCFARPLLFIKAKACNCIIINKSYRSKWKNCMEKKITIAE